MAFLKLYQHTINQFIPLISYWDTANFIMWPQSRHTHFWPCPPPIYFNQLFLLMNLYQHAKNEAFSSYCSGDLVDLKSCNLIGQEHFDPYLRNQITPKYCICARIQQIIYTFTTDQNQEKKYWPNFPINSKKNYFWFIFWVKILLLKNPAMSN